MSEHFSLLRRQDTAVAPSHDQALHFVDVPLPQARISRRAMRDLAAYQALLNQYQRFVITLRQYATELEKLRDFAAYTQADRLAVRVHIAESEERLATIREEAEVAKLERKLKKAQLERQIAELETPRSDTNQLTTLRQMTEELLTAFRQTGLADNDPLMVALRTELYQRVIRTLS